VSDYHWVPLPPDFNPIDCTVDEVASYRRESRWTVHKKIRTGVYQSYLDGRIRKVVFASVKADRERVMGAALSPDSAASTGKRKPGRPRKPRPEEGHPQLPAE
jgi:hypothetical protein